MPKQEKIKVHMSLGPKRDAELVEAMQLLEKSKLLIKSLETDIAKILGKIDN